MFSKASYRCLWRGRVLVCVRCHVYVKLRIPQYFFRSIKVLTITGLIILGIVIDLGGTVYRSIFTLVNPLNSARWTKSRPNWLPVLEKPGTVRPISRYIRSHWSIPGLVGSYVPSSLLLYRHRDCGCMCPILVVSFSRRHIVFIDCCGRNQESQA